MKLRIKSISKYLIVILLISISLSGCSMKNNQTEILEDKQAKELEKAKLSIKAATLIAEEKLTFIFYTYTHKPSNEKYFIAKDRYKNLEDVKKYLDSYYTSGMTDSLINKYLKMLNIPNLGKRPVLELPENFITYRNHQENDKKDVIKIEDNNASLIFYENGKKITYTFVKKDNKWLIDTKFVE